MDKILETPLSTVWYNSTARQTAAGSAYSVSCGWLSVLIHYFSCSYYWYATTGNNPTHKLSCSYWRVLEEGKLKRQNIRKVVRLSVCLKDTSKTETDFHEIKWTDRPWTKEEIDLGVLMWHVCLYATQFSYSHKIHRERLDFKILWLCLEGQEIRFM